MAREEWQKNNENEKKNREVYGIFTEWPTPSDVVADKREFRLTGDKNTRKTAKDKTSAE